MTLSLRSHSHEQEVILFKEWMTYVFGSQSISQLESKISQVSTQALLEIRNKLNYKFLEIKKTEFKTNPQLWTQIEPILNSVEIKGAYKYAQQKYSQTSDGEIKAIIECLEGVLETVNNSKKENIIIHLQSHRAKTRIIPITEIQAYIQEIQQVLKKYQTNEEFQKQLQALLEITQQEVYNAHTAEQNLGWRGALKALLLKVRGLYSKKTSTGNISGTLARE